jgi:hypothetical protein
VTSRKVYALGSSSRLLLLGLTGAARRPMRLHEFPVSFHLGTTEGGRSMDMRYATLSASPERPLLPPAMWSIRRSAAAGDLVAAAPGRSPRSICRGVSWASPSAPSSVSSRRVCGDRLCIKSVPGGPIIAQIHGGKDFKCNTPASLSIIPASTL